MGKYCGGDKILSTPWFPHSGGERPCHSDASAILYISWQQQQTWHDTQSNSCQHDVSNKHVRTNSHIQICTNHYTKESESISRHHSTTYLSGTWMTQRSCIVSYHFHTACWGLFFPVALVGFLSSLLTLLSDIWVRAGLTLAGSGATCRPGSTLVSERLCLHGRTPDFTLLPVQTASCSYNPLIGDTFINDNCNCKYVSLFADTESVKTIKGSYKKSCSIKAKPCLQCFDTVSWASDQ